MKPLWLAKACVVALFVSGPLAAQEEPAQMEAPVANDDWTISTLYTHSSLSGGRGDWDELDTSLYYRFNPKVVGSIRLDARQRSGDTDLIKEIGVEVYPSPRWDFRASIAHVSDPDFTYERAAALGVTWHASPRLDLLLDAKRYEFADGNITEVRPGVGVQLAANTRLTATYIHGSAYGQRSYDGGALRLDQTFANRSRLSLGVATGADPERATTGVLLSRSKSASVYYQFPVRQNMEIIVGAEREWRSGSYNRTGVSAGLVVRF